MVSKLLTEHMIISKFSRLSLAILVLAIGACVVDPGYYGGPPPPPAYGYYGYGPTYYPWSTGINIDIANGYGHGGYYGRGGYGGGRGGRR